MKELRVAIAALSLVNLGLRTMFGAGIELVVLALVTLGVLGIVLVVFVALVVGWMVLEVGSLLRLGVKFFLVCKFPLGLGGGRPA